MAGLVAVRLVLGWLALTAEWAIKTAKAASSWLQVMEAGEWAEATAVRG